jgi:putative cofactor-binding repeat protein
MPDPAMDVARYARADAVVSGFAELSVEALGF